MCPGTHALPSDPEVAPLQFAKDIQELLEEACDLRGERVVVRDRRFALREAGLLMGSKLLYRIGNAAWTTYPDWLLHPEDVREVRPAPLISTSKGKHITCRTSIWEHTESAQLGPMTMLCKLELSARKIQRIRVDSAHR